jgi:Tol biopolymer transport system component
MLPRRRILAALFAAAVAVPVLQGMQGGIIAVKPIARVDFDPIDEMSGIVRSGKFRDLYWVHNDSGDQPRFFAIRPDGKVVTPPSGEAGYEGVRVEDARNFDWEDIARDRDTLYLSDMGNNGNARRDLGIYAVKEPDPTKTTSVKPKAFYPIAYPDQKDFPPSGFRPFDCEAIFALRGKVYFVTKDRLNSLIPATSASLYRLDTRHTDRKNVLTKLDSHANLGGWVTAADVSPDGKTVAVLTQAPEQSIWLFDARAKGDKFLTQGKPRRITFSGGKQCEAIAFADNGTLLVTNEQRDIYRFKVADAKPVKAPAPVRAAKRAVRETREHIVRPLRAAL